MTSIELEQAIRDSFLDIYNVEYTGKLLVEKINPKGYCVKLGMQTPESPLVIYAELEDKDFLKFFQQELRSMNLTKVFYGTLKKIAPAECGPINRTCSCNDK